MTVDPFETVLQEQVDANIPLTPEVVKDALDQMRGAVMIVYPMGLPPHEPVKQELENTEDLSGTQVRFKLDKMQFLLQIILCWWMGALKK